MYIYMLLYYIILYYITLYIILYYIILYYIISYHIISYHSIYIYIHTYIICSANALAEGGPDPMFRPLGQRRNHCAS